MYEAEWIQNKTKTQAWFFEHDRKHAYLDAERECVYFRVEPHGVQWLRPGLRKCKSLFDVVANGS